MPLPDERPRGSVANLIGRFENQVKRQPSSSPASARSLSATSHVSGDSAKEEAKERREWPPKSTSPDVKPTIVIPSSSFSQSLALAQTVSAEAIAASHARVDVVENASLTPLSRSTTSSPDKPKPAITTPQRQLSIEVIALTPTTAEPLTTAKPPPAKAPTQAAGKTSTMTTGRTLVKSTGIRPSTAPPAHPTKSQNTGPSNTRKAVVKTTLPSNPSGFARATMAPTSARPKTPSSTVQSRTPSSGLFAPTAASLAKSRNAQQPSVPSLSKKTALSTAAAERLSKPTAASLSRTRAPTAAPLPKQSASATRGKPASKPKIGTTKKTGVTPTGRKVAAATTGAGTAIGAATEPESVSEDIVVPSKEVDDNHIDKNPEDAINSEKSLPEREESSSPVVSTEADAEAIATDEHLDMGAAEANNEADVASPGDNLESHDASVEHAENAEMAHVNGGHEPEVLPRTHTRNEIEDMVNLLESMSVSKVRPQSLASIPDEVHDIPDE